VRGKEWSRPAEAILAEIQDLARNGVKEVTLLGQSVTSYGLKNNVWPDSYKSPRGYREPFACLLEAVNDVKGIQRIRFTSGHPSGCTEELVKAMAELPAVCEHLHLPLQSGCDRILGLMNRGYTGQEYRRAVENLRNMVAGMAITTDIIVGFPSETPDDFEVTRSFMRDIGFDNAYIFKYSARPGTPAAQLADDVVSAEKMRRNKALLDDQDIGGLAINRRYEGRILEILVEGKSLRNAARWSGRTRSNKIVIFEPLPGIASGDIVMAKIDRCMAQTLYGTIVAGENSHMKISGGGRQ
jgi:tRNA-2-methylthio-N6-dimethylallyladenosine synthase